MADNEGNGNGNGDNPTVEEQLEALKTEMAAKDKDLDRYRNEKGKLSKNMEKLESKIEELQKAAMTEDEKKAAEEEKRLEELVAAKNKLAELEAKNLRLSILTGTDHGLDPVFASQVEGETEDEVLASIEKVKEIQAEVIKRLGAAQPPAGGGSASNPPPPTGGGNPTITKEMIENMSPEELEAFGKKLASGEDKINF